MEERRQHPRHTVRAKGPSLCLEAPALSEAPIDPVDFGSGGFRVQLSQRPLVGVVAECTLHVRGTAVSGLRARVAWTREETEEPGVWIAGLAVQMDEDERDDFVTALSGLLSEMMAGS